jgi:hypothetical protein
MSLVSMISDKCVQTAVYWGAPVEDGYGGKTYATPVEILCRWEDVEQLLGTMVGGEISGSTLISSALVYVLEDLVEEGCLYLGTLDDLNSQQKIDPQLVAKAYIIKRFDKSPGLGSTTEFLRKAYLSPFKK